MRAFKVATGSLTMLFFDLKQLQSQGWVSYFELSGVFEARQGPYAILWVQAVDAEAVLETLRSEGLPYFEVDLESAAISWDADHAEDLTSYDSLEGYDFP